MFRLPSLDLIRISSIIALSSSMIIGSIALRGVLDQHQRAGAALVELQLFELATAAATAITKERRPLELALSAEPADAAGLTAELKASRADADRSIARFRQLVESSALASSMNFNFLTALLRDERRAADALLALPLAERQVSLQLRVARGMSSISQTFVPFVDKTAQRVIEADESLAGRVNVARLLGALYEAATRLPSEVMPALKRSEVIPPEAVMTSMRVQQRILALWDVGVSQLEFGLDSPRLSQAHEEIRSVYFGKGFPFLSRAIETHSRRPLNSVEQAKRISEVYAPTTLPILRMRNLYVDAMMKEAVTIQESTLLQMKLVVCLTVLILVMTAIAAWVLYRQMLRPLLGVRDQILALCERRPLERRPYLGSVRAVASLYKALETLEDRDRQRMVLELERADLSERLRTLSETDELTALPNRRGLFARLDGFGEQGRDYVTILGDIDHFKAVNDTYGHGPGDEVLAAFSECLRARASPDVVVARYGGEEFAIVMRSDQLEAVLAFAEDLRAEVEALVVETSAGTIRITASFGLAHEVGPVAAWPTLFDIADRALYEAKAAGRNRVRLCNATIMQLGASALSSSGALSRPGEAAA
ncbi:GGDEF domain-containing protein [Aureimonas sp. AU22]|uniref:GGDEF domain-containing protein n=1 Tax=Aureimonas sp. AU22 TaxID=1638162 RepID=UPI00078632F9|nr:GGDEF domain-containing protein [Aureimonas sp. AU22]